MRGQVTGRELDDVGDAVLSYAEVKALATGNPLVIEQAGVQAELAKLDRLARAHHSQQRRLERTAAGDRREAHRYRDLETAFTAAIVRRTDTSGDRFSIELDGDRYTSRIDAGNALLERARDIIHEAARHRGDSYETRPRTIGRLAGFPLRLDGYKLGQTLEARLTTVLDDTNTIALRLTAEDLHGKKPEAVLAQLEGPIRKLDDKLAAAGRMAAEFQQRAGEVEARLGQPFADQHRLDQLRRRYQQILDELNTETEPDPPAQPSDQPPTPDQRLDQAGDQPPPEPPGLD